MDLTLSVLSAHGAVVQDLGRTRAHEGLSTGGARDQGAARGANALVGNAPSAPLAEVLLGHLAVRFDRDALVAATGASPEMELEGVPVAAWEARIVPAGSTLTMRVTAGAVAYLAIAGVWDVPRLAGSAAPDPALDFGTALTAGAATAVTGAPRRVVGPVLGAALLRPPPLRRHSDGSPACIDLMAGPDLTPALREALAVDVFTTDPRSDHVGLRLRGLLPPAETRAEPLSRGVPVGAVELPGADGELIVLQRGRSLTAGYPVVAIASRAAQDIVAQLLPGDEVLLRWRSIEDCVREVRRAIEQEARTRSAIVAALGALNAID